MANKYVKRISRSSVVKESQIEFTMRHNVNPLELVKN